MGTTKSPQETAKCPNCGAEGVHDYGTGSFDDPVHLVDCDNNNCAVDRFWSEMDDE